MLGKRRDFGKADVLAPGNIGYAMIGASMLWVGWFGFNAGSALGANGQAGMAMFNTHIAAAAATLAWVGSEWLLKGKPTLLGASCGIVAGLVGVTPAAGFIDPMGALMIGAAAGLVCYLACAYLKDIFGYDDSLDVVGVHGVGGILGALLTGVFAMEAIGGKTGLLEGNMDQLIAQFKGVGITLVYSGVVTAAILLVISKTIGLRVSAKEEDTGLDLSVHGERESL
jgi:Amt family ammonium transporter